MGKASRKKKLRRLDKAGQECLVERVRESLPGEKIKIVATEQKMSDVLTEFAEPWLALTKDQKQYKTTLGFAVLAWNMALEPAAERWAGIDPELLQALGAPGRLLLDEMVARKLEFYAHINRPIFDFEFSGEGGHLRFNVVSGVTNPELYLGSEGAAKDIDR